MVSIQPLVDIGVCVAGNVDSGKSTTLGHLVFGQNDDGNGKLRNLVARHPHEVKTGKTSDVVYHTAIIGSNRITFGDLAGHEKYLKTTIAGLGSFIPDLVCVCIDRFSSSYKMTREHIGIAIRMDIPFIVLMTKTDMYNNQDVYLNELRLSLKRVKNRKLFLVKSQEDLKTAISAYKTLAISPVFYVSNVTGKGFDLVKGFLSSIQKIESRFKHPSLFSVERDYRIKGIGLVVSGYNGGQPISVGDKLLINNEIECTIKSIHDDYKNPIKTLSSKVRGCLALNAETKRVAPGSVITYKPVELTDKITVRAEILTSHSTTIKAGYQTVIHCGAVRRVGIVEGSDITLRGGDKNVVTFRLTKKGYFEKGLSLFFREGKIIGDGTIL